MGGTGYGGCCGCGGYGGCGGYCAGSFSGCDGCPPHPGGCGGCCAGSFSGCDGYPPHLGALVPSVDSFIAQWGLDAGAQRALMGLDSETQKRVLSGFTPPPNTIKSTSALFMGFVRGFADN